MARLNRLLAPMILLFLLSPCRAGEGRRKTHVIDVPRLTVGDTLPRESQPDRYFFLDEAEGDLILIFPSDLSEENFGAPSDKERVRERVRLAIGVKPTVETLVETEARFRYEYRLGNESQATKRIGKWVLELPTLGEQIGEMNAPAGWDFNTWALPDEWVERSLSVMNLIPGARPITERELVRNQVKWWYRGLGGATLEPGTCCLSFSIRSRNLPGIVTAYFQGNPYAVSTTGAVPRVLSWLVPAFNFIETNSVSMPVIGPKFEPTSLVEARVCDIIGDVERLAGEGRLQATPLTEALLPLSEGCLGKTAAELKGALRNLHRESLDPFEREILSALQINLGFR